MQFNLQQLKDILVLRLVVMIESALSIGFVCLGLSTFLVLSNPIQTTKMGVIFFTISLLLVARKMFQIAEKYPDIRPLFMYQLDVLKKYKKYMFAFIALAPILISSFANGGLSGGVNPLGFWNSELYDSKNSDCKVTEELTVIAADSLRVTNNKFNMGIATIAELKGSIDSYNFLKKTQEECLKRARIRQETAIERLKELRQPIHF